MISVASVEVTQHWAARPVWGCCDYFPWTPQPHRRESETVLSSRGALHGLLFKILNWEHLLKADNSNGRILKNKSGFSFFFAFCLFVPQKMTSARSLEHTWTKVMDTIVAWTPLLRAAETPPPPWFFPSEASLGVFQLNAGGVHATMPGISGQRRVATAAMDGVGVVSNRRRRHWSCWTHCRGTTSSFYERRHLRYVPRQ